MSTTTHTESYRQVEIPPIPYTPEVLIFPTPQEVDLCSAQVVQEQLMAKPDSVLTLPTGGTPVGMYRHLVESCRAGTIDFSQVRAFNLDEYYPIDPNHQASYARFMRDNLYAHVNMNSDRIYVPNGAAPDPDIEAAEYEALIKQYGPVDLAVLGIGPGNTCHIGFNERGSDVNSRSRYMALDQQTQQANSIYFAENEVMPTGSLTQGIATILEATRIILLAKGAGKAWGIQRALRGDIGSDAPASYLRYHPNVTFILDHQAAQYL